ncbi:hypothetical protein B0H34DRAFT_795026 [Crassisporium funariophilum]|nr:hypothetical protein B0H34DRAFT_795026 [Crassisporium funariophilum]
MSDEQKARLALDLVLENCKAALSALAQAGTEASQKQDNHASTDFATLRTDFLSILSLLHAASTKIALVLKPSSPQHKAALVPLRDISNNVAALVHSIRLMRQDQGATLLKDYEFVARNVIGAIESLTQTFLTNHASTSNTVKAMEDYLVRTGGVHDLIDMARKPGALPLTNREAVRKRWQQDHDSLVDGAEEIQEICATVGPDELEADDFADDGWDELGLASKQTLSAVELDRAEKVRSMVKLAVLLHKRVLRDVLSPGTHKEDNPFLDALGELSNELLAASDDLISSMYAPQQLMNIANYHQAFRDVVHNLCTTLLRPQNKGLEEQLKDMSLSTAADSKSSAWFATCFEQIDKAGARIESTLAEPNSGSGS